MNSTEQRLFTPGSGAIPPALTGREPEQAVLDRCLADPAGGASPPHDVVLTGPRGNGKTALLKWFKAACEDRKPDVVALTPDEIPDRVALIAALSPRTVDLDVEAACPAGRPRGVAPARLRLVPVGPVATRHLERRHSLADGPRARSTRPSAPERAHP